jgi:RNA-directed DNA polymerase
VTQNAGRKTAGVDGIVWKTAAQKHQAARSLQRRSYQTLPLRRIYIPKKNGKLRPSGIPAMSRRAMQALHLEALEPIAETLADPNSYGFRHKRSTADAIGQCFIALSRKQSAEWIFEGDIKACFDRLNHTWLEDHIPMDKIILRKWFGGRNAIPRYVRSPAGLLFASPQHPRSAACASSFSQRKEQCNDITMLHYLCRRV